MTNHLLSFDDVVCGYGDTKILHGVSGGVAATSPLEPYFEAFPRLAERLDQLAGSMSGGERKILSFVRAMLEETEVTILDEPSEDVQPENIVNKQNCIRAKQSVGRVFLLVVQYLNKLMALAGTYVGLPSGHGVFQAGKSECSDDLLRLLSV
ncbi:MAG: ATP-binding cassette domain-containing protein [Roseobacter sp.]